MAVTERIASFVGDRQAARWDRFGGPSAGLRWSFRHPWLVTLGVAMVLAAILGATFGVPPFSPLVLVVLLVAPIQPVLRAQQRIHTRWQARRDAPTGEAPQGDGPRGDGPQGDGPTGDGPRGDGPRGDGPTGDEPPSGAAGRSVA